MIVVLAGIATVLLVVSEIAAIVPTREAKRLRTVSLWGALPALVLFAAAWLVQIQRLLTQAP